MTTTYVKREADKRGLSILFMMPRNTDEITRNGLEPSKEHRYTS